MTFHPNLFAGKVALVTGGTQGIGAGIAHHLARLGARVIAAGINVESSVREVDGGSIETRHLDVADQGSVDALFADLGSLDLLVNCAGIIKRGEEHQVDVFQQVIEVNLTGTMRVCTAARPLLAKSKGCIVNTASMLTFFGGGLVPGYSASKGGIGQLTKSLAIAYASDDIRVNAIAPGWIATPMTAALQNDPARNSPILARTPLGRWGTPDDVASGVVFLCSGAAGFVTGITLPIDGGYMVS
ncbi:SDR family NAD(P)-dependent oxidoreductase [Massilia brevitalea]|uniref:SDR family NAD(P)-dependent oxidoreductase n=1 Tax=Massilia brevitalea TaxID=442526 RepID=UPI00273A169D|nr:SDR family oxidoreductase [Massilia brevitalea]